MQDRKDYLGDKFRLIERAQEDIYFRKLDGCRSHTEVTN